MAAAIPPSSSSSSPSASSLVKLWPQGLPFLLPLSVLLLQTFVPILIRFSYKSPSSSGTPIFDSSTNAEGMEDVDTNHTRYHPASVTLFAELLKCFIASAWMFGATLRHSPTITGSGSSSKSNGIITAAIEVPKRFFKATWFLRALLLPSVLYFASNITAMHALSHLRSYIFTAIMNSRIVFAALLSMTLLNKSISGEQWRAIIIIFCAATVLCLEDMQVNDDYTVNEESIGMLIAVGTAVVSAAGGVLVEKLLAAPSASSSSSSTTAASVAGAGHMDHRSSASFLLWEQQGVLSCFSAIFAGLYVMLFHWEDLKAGQLLQGWNGVTVLLTVMQAIQGLVVALTIQKCGIVIRLLLGTISICLCILFEGLFFREPIMFREILSIAMVLVGSNLYFTAAAKGQSTHTHTHTSSIHPSSSGIVSGSGNLHQGNESLGSSGGNGGGAQDPLKGKNTHAHTHTHTRSSFYFKNSADNSRTLKQLTALLVVALLYISASSSFSVMLASKAHVEDALTETEVLRQAAAADEASSSSSSSLILNEQGDVGGSAGTVSALARRSSRKKRRHQLGGVKVEEEEEQQEEQEPEPEQEEEEEEEEQQEEEKDEEEWEEVEEKETDKKQEAAAPPQSPLEDLTGEVWKSYFGEFMNMLTTSDDSLLKAAAVTLTKKEKGSQCDIAAMKAAETDPWNPKAKDGKGHKRDVGVCLQIRNDAGILDEYIAFHWVQGASKFIIYDDGSADDPWSVLEKYVGLGIVEFHDMLGHPQTSTNELQTDNLNACFKELARREKEKNGKGVGLRWLMFPDVDEFWMSSVEGETLSEALNSKYDEVPCMEIARTFYGSSFNHKKQPGLVTENFLLSSPDYLDGYPKMLANLAPKGKERTVEQLYTVHNFIDQDAIGCKWKNDIRDLRINHYVRSLEDYEHKMLTGHAALNRYTRPLQIFWERDRNELYRPVAGDYACQVHALLEQIEEMKAEGKIPAVERPKPWNATREEGR